MDVLRWLAALSLAACVPDVDIDESILGDARIYAVRAEPAEAAPGDTVRFVALYAGRDGIESEAPIDWAVCTGRKPLAELGPVAPACLAEVSDALVPIGQGIEASGVIPRDACRLFGPEPPPATAGEPAGRPVDPDATGGYAQPVRLLDGDGNVSLFELRLACGLFGATQAESVAFTQRYRRNTPPSIERVELEREDGREVVIEDGVPAEVRAGEQVTLRVVWPECPLEDTCGDGLCGIDETITSCREDCATPSAGCGGAERYLRFDLASRSLDAERESLRVAWYSSGGTFEAERTGVSADEIATFSENALVVPETAGELAVIVVIRDARGGTGWREVRLRIEP